MRRTLVPFFLLIASFSPGFAQTQIDAATRQDVEDLMQLTGAHDRMPLIYSAMASQFALGFADRYRQQHPNANPAEVQKAATDVAEQMQQMLKAIPTDEVLDAMIPVYQKYLTHSDIKAIIEFDRSPTGQKLLKNTNAMMIEAMQAAHSVLNKHIPEIQAQIEKAPAGESQPTPAQPATPASTRILVSVGVSEGLLVKQVPPIYPPLARQARIQGTVVLQAIIDKDGSVKNLQLVSGHPMLVNAAMDAVMQWQYKPYVVDGAAVEVQTTVNVNFSLVDDSQTTKPN